MFSFYLCIGGTIPEEDELLCNTIKFHYYYNDDIQPSKVISNQLPSGLVLVIFNLIIHGLNAQL